MKEERITYDTWTHIKEKDDQIKDLRLQRQRRVEILSKSHRDKIREVRRDKRKRIEDSSCGAEEQTGTRNIKELYKAMKMMSSKELYMI